MKTRKNIGVNLKTLLLLALFPFVNFTESKESETLLPMYAIHLKKTS